LPLRIAFVLSLAFHLALYTLAHWAGLHAPSPPPPRSLIEAMLILPEIAAPPPEEPAEPVASDPVPVVEAPAVVAPVELPPPPSPPLPVAAKAPPRADLKPAAAPPRFYPREAVLRGLEGEVLVNVSTDASGRVREARLERGSGHAILDAAALAAVRSLKSLPANTREAVVPVRFRLE